MAAPGEAASPRTAGARLPPRLLPRRRAATARSASAVVSTRFEVDRPVPVPDRPRPPELAEPQ